MSNYEIIGVSGKASSGKDYIAHNILKPLGYYQFSLAWHFKVGLVGMGKATFEEVFITKPPKVRKMLQEVGTEQGRDLYGEDVWVNTMTTWFQLLNETWGIDKFVVPDVRFPNEADAIIKLDGKVFRLVAPERVAKSALTVSQRMHPSEISLDNYDDFTGFIWNDPKYSESVKKQVYDLLGEETEAQGIVWNAVDAIQDKFENVLEFFKGNK